MRLLTCGIAMLLTLTMHTSGPTVSTTLSRSIFFVTSTLIAKFDRFLSMVSSNCLAAGLSKDWTRWAYVFAATEADIEARPAILEDWKLRKAEVLRGASRQVEVMQDFDRSRMGEMQSCQMPQSVVFGALSRPAS